MGLMERVIRFAEQLGGALHARPRPAQLQQRPQVHPQDAQDAPQKLSESDAFCVKHCTPSPIAATHH